MTIYSRIAVGIPAGADVRVRRAIRCFEWYAHLQKQGLRASADLECVSEMLAFSDGLTNGRLRSRRTSAESYPRHTTARRRRRHPSSACLRACLPACVPASHFSQCLRGRNLGHPFTDAFRMAVHVTVGSRTAPSGVAVSTALG